MKEDLNKYGRINTVGFMTPYYVKDSGFRDVYKFYDSILNSSGKKCRERSCGKFHYLNYMIN